MPDKDKEFAKAFEEGLPEGIERMRKATENFPFPPGEEHREAAEEHRRMMAKTITYAMNRNKKRPK